MSSPTKSTERPGRERRAFSALLRAFLLIDLRGQHYGASTGSKPSDPVPPLYWVFAQYLTISCLLSAAMMARVDVWFFAFASLSTSMILILSALIVELDEAILDPADREILAHRPIAPRAYTAARLVNLLAYVAMMSAALTLFPAVTGASLADAGPLYAPAYLLASIVASVAAASVTVLLHSFGARLQDLRAGLAWVQILLVMVIFYGGQLMLRNADGTIELFAAHPPAWTRWLPSGLLASWVEGAAKGLAKEHSTAVLTSVGVAGALAVAAWWRLTEAYRALQGAGHRAGRSNESAPPRPGTLAGRFAPWLTRSRTEAMGFALTSIMLRRDADLRLRIGPSLAPAAAALALAVFSHQAENPFLSTGNRIVLPLALIPLLAGAAPAALHALRFSRDHAASFVFRSAPLADRALFLAGARRALLAQVFAPFTVLVTAVLAVVWRRPLDAIALAAVLWATLELSARVSTGAALGDLPLSAPAARGSMAGSIAIVSSVVAFVCSTVAGALYLLSGDPRRMFIAAIAFSIVALLVARLGEGHSSGGRRG